MGYTTSHSMPYGGVSCHFHMLYRRRLLKNLPQKGGGHALFDASPLQRFHRDIHAASHHAALSWDILAEQYGRVLLGLELTYLRF